MTETLHMDPELVDEKIEFVEAKFDTWYKEDYGLISRQYFDEFTQCTFLAFLKQTLLLIKENNGSVNSNLIREKLERICERYFSEKRFQNMIDVIREDDWDSINSNNS